MCALVVLPLFAVGMTPEISLLLTISYLFPDAAVLYTMYSGLAVL